jgi:uncharacterized protein (TIRG00374 family)
MTRFVRLRYLFWLAVPLLLGWAWRDTSLAEVGAVLSRLSLGQILALLAANGMVLLLLSNRWWLILRVQGHAIPYLTLAGYRLAAFAVSYVTPGPQFGGEPLQVYLLQQRHSVLRAEAVAAVTLDKLLELLVNFIFLALGVFTILQGRIFANWPGQPVIFIVLALLALPVSFLAAFWAGRHPVSGLWRGVISSVTLGGVRRNRPTSSIYQSIYQTIHDSEDHITHFCRSHPWAMTLLLLISILTWGALIGEYWLALYVLGLNLAAGQVISMLTVVRLAFLLPLPAGLGALEAGQVLVVTALGLHPAVAISVSLLMRVRDAALTAAGLGLGTLLVHTGKKYYKPY